MRKEDVNKSLKKIIQDGSQESSGKRRVKQNLSELQEGDYFRGTVKILRIAKPGPLILKVFDGTATLDAIAHDRIFERDEDSSAPSSNTYDFGNLTIKDNRKKPAPKTEDHDEEEGEIRSEKDLSVDNTIKIFGKAKYHQGRIEIELKSMRMANVDFEHIMNTKSLPIQDEFSISSERYNSMKGVFTAIAQRIRKAIMEQQPILIRHHNDGDGISAGLAIEQAILNVMERRDIEPKNLIYRSASASPFYDHIDLFRDVSKFNRYSEKFGDPSPLVLLLDTGSTPENLVALKILQSFEFECIIVDHHNPGPVVEGKSAVCDLLSMHLNPYIFGWDSQTCGGMLCYELARFIDEEYENPLLPAVAALADRCNISEVDAYIEIAGRDKEELIQMGRVMDYLAYNFKFDSGDAVYDKVFTNPKLVEIVGTQVDEMFQQALDSLIPILDSKDIKGVCYTEIDLEKYSQRGKYPTAGKILGIGHDYIAQKENRPVLTAGFFTDGVIFRATAPVLPVPTLLEQLQQALPHAKVEGGGHEQAGSLKFLPAYFDQVHNFILQELEYREI